MRYKLVAISLLLLLLAIAPLIVMAEDTHDISIISVTPSRGATYPGRWVDIKVVVKNNGNVTEIFNATTWRNDTSTSFPIEEISGINLAPGENQTLTFHWNTTGLTYFHIWTISANVTFLNAILDINLLDNEVFNGDVKIAQPGDVNADRKINLDDLILAAISFGDTPVSPAWNPMANILNDNIININDFVRIAQHFGETY
jgi:hypothetical protein